jgi:hypothetical protein
MFVCGQACILLVLLGLSSGRTAAQQRPAIPQFFAAPVADVPEVVGDRLLSPDGQSPTAQPTPGGQGGGAARPATASGPGKLVYDAAMDNLLMSPAEPIGLFGLPVREVESILRTYGARPYSYAFGKYSRMTFSVYLITLRFDRHRRLGAISVEPRPPFSDLESSAREFFMRLFLQGGNLSRFNTVIAGNRLEIRYGQEQYEDQ